MADDRGRYDQTVVIGRFAPYHLAHHDVVRTALTRSDLVLVLMGSADSPRTPRDPFTYAERRDMILGSFAPADAARLRVRPLPDATHQDDLWFASVRAASGGSLLASGLAPADATVALVGHDKDGTSWYLRHFPEWSFVDCGRGHDGLSATHIRDRFFVATGGDDADGVTGRLADAVPRGTLEVLDRMFATPPHAEVCADVRAVHEFRRPYAGLRHEPLFVTADPVVIHAGRVLMVRRGRRPGKGLWALPGGFVEARETIASACERELFEETSMAVDPGWLRSHAVARQVFDDVHRDLRGRFVTHATLFLLPGGGDPPAVTGGDDADEARWLPVEALRREDTYADHLGMIRSMLADVTARGT